LRNGADGNKALFNSPAVGRLMRNRAVSVFNGDDPAANQEIAQPYSGRNGAPPRMDSASFEFFGRWAVFH